MTFCVTYFPIYNFLNMPLNYFPRHIMHCSFCEKSGHRLYNCIDDRLLSIDTMFRSRKNEMESLPLPTIDIIFMFYNWLIEEVDNENDILQVYAFQKCGRSLIDDTNYCCEQITSYIWSSVWYCADVHAFREQLLTQPHQTQKRIETNLKPSDCIQTDECSICYEITKFNETVCLGCNHMFCYKCVKKLLQSSSSCALCRSEIVKMTFREKGIRSRLVGLF